MSPGWNRGARSRVGGSMRGASLALVLGATLAMACGGSPSSDTTAPPRERPTAPDLAPVVACPASPIDVEVAPGTRPEHRDPEFWVGKIGEPQADAVLVDAATIPELNARFTEVEGSWRDPLGPRAEPAELKAQLEERLGWIEERVSSGALIEGEAGSFAAAQEIARTTEPVDEVRMVAEEASLWCVPLDTGLYKEPVDRDFDRNRCASLHPGEAVRVLGREGDWHYVHAGHTIGWLHAPTLTPPLPPQHLADLLAGPRLVPTDDDLRTEGGRRLRLGTVAPVTGRDGQIRVVLVPTAEGLVEDRVTVGPALSEGLLPLSRRNAWSLALSEQDTPYGWGGRAGNRDCSRLVRDVMASFGLQLGRHSGVQGKLGSYNVDVSTMSEPQKLEALRREHQRGLVLLYMPGHIMMYLGEDQGQHYAVSAISEYLEPCEGGPDTVYRLGRVAVTTLELGRGTERTAYIERLATLVVFGPQG